jgi:hypothetical protein
VLELVEPLALALVVQEPVVQLELVQSVLLEPLELVQ